MTGSDEFITIAEATRKYGHGRQWWHDRIAAGDLPVYDVPARGKRGTYLKRSEVEAYLQPKPKSREQDQ